MKFFYYFVLLLITRSVFCYAETNSYSISNKYGYYTVTGHIGTFKSKERNFSVTITLNTKKQVWRIKMKAKTKGWLAIGFDRTKIMKDSEIILGYVDKTNVYLSHEYGVSWFTHKPINRLVKNYKSILTILSYQEKNDSTTITFERPLKTHGPYYKNLTPGRMINFLYAYSQEDKSRKKHRKKNRGFIKIKLPE